MKEDGTTDDLEVTIKRLTLGLVAVLSALGTLWGYLQ